MVKGVIFGVEYLILAKKRKIPGKQLFFWVHVWPFWGSAGAFRWSGMVVPQISDRFEIGGTKEVVRGVIFGVEYENRDARETAFWVCV